MSRLKELIKELCPNGVEYKKLWEVTIWDKKFNGISKEKQSSTISYKYYLSSEFDEVEDENGDIYYISTGISGKDRYTTEEKAKEYVSEGEIVCIPWGGTPNVKYYKGKFVTGDNRIATSRDIKILANKFLFYWLQNSIKELSNYYRGSGIKHPNMASVLDMKIAVPPLEVQDEIVRILDNFTLLSAELSAELKARKQQYKYYRDKLLKNNKNKVEIKTLDDVCNISAGGDVPKENFSKEKNEKYNIPIISNGVGKNALYGYTDIVKIDKKAVTIAARGTIGYAEYRDYSYYPIIRLISAVPKNENELNTKFLYYSLQGRKYDVPTTGIPQLTVPTFKKEKISIPEIKIQEKIVEVLDNFKKICSDLKIGLPAEIEARQKQYEFYRDTLLTYAATGDKTRQAIIRLIQYVFGSVEITLGEIGNVCMCKRIMKNETNSISGIPFYKIGTFGKVADAYISEELFDEYKNKYSYPKKGDVLISASGTIGRTVIFNEEKSYFQDSNIVWIDNDEQIVTNKFLKYLYSTIEWQVEGGTIKRLYNNNLKKTKIIIPSIKKQNEIVRILDNFEKIITDIQDGLPSEIEARQKQYEYYRDKLLTFKELK